MKPTERRQQERRAMWLRNVAIVLLTLLSLAALQIIVVLNTLPVTLPDPPAQKPAPAASRWYF